MQPWQILLTFWIILFNFNVGISQDFNPMTDASGYMLNFFHLTDQSIETDSILQANIGDTLVISWFQPKHRSEQPKPIFRVHNDTIQVWVENSADLYRYASVGNDSALWVSKIIELYGGYWELSITCHDIKDLISQYSEPFLFAIAAPPGQPYEIFIILKKRQL